jgi:CBS domain-containing protein
VASRRDPGVSDDVERAARAGSSRKRPASASPPYARDRLETARAYLEIHMKTGGRRTVMTTIGEVMKSPVVTVRPDDKLMEIINLSRQRGIRHLPVVEGDKLLGIVSDPKSGSASRPRSTPPSPGW